MIKVNDFASKIFGILIGFNCQLKMFDLSGKEVLNPENARRFYSFEPNLMVTLNIEDQSLSMSLGNDLQLKDTEKLQAALKNLANIYLYNYQLTKFAKHIQPKDFSADVKMEPVVSESFSRLSGSKHKSSQVLEQVKIVLHHSKAMAESSMRSRHIKKICLEFKGESFVLPTRSITAARAAARHVSNGGNINDTVGQYIFEQSSRFFKLKEFLKYAKVNSLINESTYDTIRAVKESMYSIKLTLESLSKPKKYEITKARVLEHDLKSDLLESEVDAIKDQFTVKRFDEKFNDVLPLINKANDTRKQFIEHVSQISTMAIPLSRPLSENSNLVEFTSAESALTFKLNDLKGALQDSYLVKFVTETIEKVNTNTVSSFDVTVIENIIRNSFVAEPTNVELHENLITKFMLSIAHI